MTGDIFHGRLRAPFGGVSSPMTTTLPLVPGTLSNAELRADVTLTGLSGGQMGGSTPVMWFVNAAEAIMPGIGSTVRSVMESTADIQPTTADPAICGDVSSALTLSGVPATRTP